MALSLNTQEPCGGQNQIRRLIRSAGKRKLFFKRFKARGQGKPNALFLFTLKSYYSIVISAKYEL